MFGGSATPPALLIHPQPLQQLPATAPSNDQSQTRRATKGDQPAQTSDPDQTGEALQICDPIHTLSIREYGRQWYMFSPSSKRSNEPKRSNTMKMKVTFEVKTAEDFDYATGDIYTFEHYLNDLLTSSILPALSVELLPSTLNVTKKRGA